MESMDRDRDAAIEALMDGTQLIWPSEEAIETVLYSDRQGLHESFRMLVEWPVLDAEPTIYLEGPEHEKYPLCKHGHQKSTCGSCMDLPNLQAPEAPEGDETDGW